MVLHVVVQQVLAESSGSRALGSFGQGRNPCGGVLHFAQGSKFHLVVVVQRCRVLQGLVATSHHSLPVFLLVSQVSQVEARLLVVGSLHAVDGVTLLLGERGVLGEIQVLLEVFLALRLVAHSVHKHTCVVVVVHHLRQVEFVHGGNGLLGCYLTFLIGLVVLLHALGEVDDRLVKMGAECKRIEGQLLRCAVEFGREHLLVQLATQAVEFGKSRGLRVGQGCLERSVGFVIKHKGSGLVVGLQQVVGLLHFVLHLPISIVLCSGAAGYQKQGGT